jgi:phosphatidate cytidylyltransferase
VVGILFALGVCIFSDIGGYIIGKSIGGKKLTKISPNKTVSGSIGSFLFSLFPLGIMMVLEQDLEDRVVLFCLSLSLACQLGDLIISYFKRLAKVKDTGKILPGHGGMLDRIDGIIFAITSTPIILIMLS